MLSIGVALFVAKGVSGLYITGAAQMPTSRYRFEKCGTLLGSTVGDIDDRRRACRRRAVAHLPHVILRTNIVACSGIAGELQLTGMGIDEQVILLHIGYEEGVARRKAVIHTHTVYGISRLCARQTRHRHVESVGVPPLTGGMVFDNHMVIEGLQVIDEVGAVIPCTEIGSRDAVATVGCGMAYLACPYRGIEGNEEQERQYVDSKSHRGVCVLRFQAYQSYRPTRHGVAGRGSP